MSVLDLSQRYNNSSQHSLAIWLDHPQDNLLQNFRLYLKECCLQYRHQFLLLLVPHCHLFFFPEHLQQLKMFQGSILPHHYLNSHHYHYRYLSDWAHHRHPHHHQEYHLRQCLCLLLCLIFRHYRHLGRPHPLYRLGLYLEEQLG